MFVVCTAKGYGGSGKTHVRNVQGVAGADRRKSVSEMGGSAGAIGADMASYGRGEEADIQICKFGSPTQAKYSDCAHLE